MARAVNATPRVSCIVRIAAVVAAAASITMAAGCLPSITLRTGRAIGADNVAALVPGKTTKVELFERFGAPAAIVVRGEVTVVLAPRTWATPFRNDATYSFDAATFHELFPAPAASPEYLRIYYFRHVASRKRNYFMLLALYGQGDTSWDRLWVLVDEKAGIVRDYAFRKSGATTVFGVPRGAGPR